MVISTKTILKWLTLLLVAILSMVLWRWESAYHGWDGLIWIGYHHYAVYGGGLLFIFWANWVTSLEWPQRIYLNAVGLGFVWLTYYLFSNLYFLTFGRYILGVPAWLPWALFVANLLIFPLWFLGVKLCFSLAQIKIAWKTIVLSLVVVFLGIVTAPWLIKTFHLHRFGYDDFIHLVKTGAVIPAIVISMGIMVLGGKKIDSKKYPIDSNSGILDAP